MEYYEPIFKQHHSKGDNESRKGDLGNKDAKVPREEKRVIRILLASYLFLQI